MLIKLGKSLALVVLLFGALRAIQAQSPSPSATATPQTITPETPPKPKPAASPALSPTEAKVKRWFEFDQFISGFRYNFAENENKKKTANNFQWELFAKFRFKFD